MRLVSEWRVRVVSTPPFLLNQYDVSNSQCVAIRLVHDLIKMPVALHRALSNALGASLFNCAVFCCCHVDTLTCLYRTISSAALSGTLPTTLGQLAQLTYLFESKLLFSLSYFFRSILYFITGICLLMKSVAHCRLISGAWISCMACS